MHLKTGFTWRQIIKVPIFDYCMAMKIGGITPYFQNRIEAFRNYYPTLAWDCPLMPGNYTSNHTYDYPENAIATRSNVTQIVQKRKDPIQIITEANGFKYMKMDIPNGIYKVVINLTSKIDPMVFQVEFQFETRERLGDDKF
jgi:hypothetical protein